MVSDEKMPIHFNPAKSRSFSSVSLKDTFDEMAQTRSFSVEDVAPRIFCVASAHGIFSFKKLCSSSERKPMSTKTFNRGQHIVRELTKVRVQTLMKSGKPPYLRVPLMIVLASGILYLSLYGVESPLNCNVSNSQIITRYKYETFSNCQKGTDRSAYDSDTPRKRNPSSRWH